MKAITIFALFVLFYSTHAYVAKLDEYQASLQTWKSIQPRTYTYRHQTEYFLPTETSRNYTDITVTDGKVVKRAYTITDGFDNILSEWAEETPQEIGSHDQGFKALTLDQLYSQCRENVLVYDDVLFTIAFTTDANGVMIQCDSRNSLWSHPNIMGFSLNYIAFE